MKKLLIFIVMLSATQVVKAQATDVSGTLKDEEGQAIHFAFLKDIQSKAATYSDSLGNFTIKINPSSSLYINSFGFRDTLVKIGGRTNITVVLKNSVNISASKVTSNPNEQGVSNDAGRTDLSDVMARNQTPTIGEGTPTSSLKLYVGGGYKTFTENPQLVDAASGAIFPTFNPKEETQGSRYLLKGWIHGYVVDTKDEVIQAPGNLFEYDKMGGGLLLTKNGKSAIEVNRDMVKAFTLFDNSNIAYVFENVPQISQTHYVQVLASGDRYKIYKEIKTTFAKANYASDGVMSSGHNYDEYTDEYTYYVYDVKTNAVQKLSLKKKAIKEAFSADADKLSKFMNDHSSDSIDDMYLEELGSSLNE